MESHRHTGTPSSRVPSSAPTRIPRGQKRPAGPIGRRLRSLAHITKISLRTLEILANNPGGSTANAIIVRAKNPGILTLKPYSDLFGVSLDWLGTGVGHKPKPSAVRARILAAIDDHNRRVPAADAIERPVYAAREDPAALDDTRDLDDAQVG